jgi:dTMP kinase
MNESIKTVADGLLVAFEGIDGAGKTSQLHEVAASLRSAGWLVQTIRAHGGTPIGEALRDVSFSSLERPAATNLYISRAIHEALAQTIDTWRHDGAIILMDRSPLSIAGYQINGDGLDPELGWSSIDAILAKLKIDLILFYAVSLEVARQRLAKRAQKSNYFESKPQEYFEAVKQGYERAAEKYEAVTIDAGQSFDAIQVKTQSLIQAALEQKTTSA